MSREELVKEGLNESITHVDFMVGSQDMNIDGITADGKESLSSETEIGLLINKRRLSPPFYFLLHTFADWHKPFLI